jgi:hypothetical protein
LNPRVLLSAAVIAALNSGGVFASCTDLDVAEAEGLAVSHAFDLVTLCLPDPHENSAQYTWAASDNLQVELVLHPALVDRERYIFAAVKPVSSTYEASRTGRIEFNAFTKKGGEKGELKSYSIDVRFTPGTAASDAQELHTSKTPAASGACMAPADFRVSNQAPQSENTNSLTPSEVRPEAPAVWEPPVANNRVMLGSSNGLALWEPQVVLGSMTPDRSDNHQPALWAPSSESVHTPALWSPKVVSRAQMITQLFEASSDASAGVTAPALWEPEYRITPQPSRQASKQGVQLDTSRQLWQP